MEAGVINSKIGNLIIHFVANEYGVSVDDVKSPSRRREFAEPRQVAMYLIRYNTRLSLEAIGTLFIRNHATVLHGIKNVERLREYDKQFIRGFEPLYKKFKRNILPEIRINATNEELEKLRTLKMRTDAIRKEGDKRVSTMYYLAYKPLSKMRDEVAQDNIMEGFRKKRIIDELDSAINKLKESKMALA